MWSLALQKDINIKDMASYVAPYPTLAEVNTRAAISLFLPQRRRARGETGCWVAREIRLRGKGAS